MVMTAWKDGISQNLFGTSAHALHLVSVAVRGLLANIQSRCALSEQEMNPLPEAFVLLSLHVLACCDVALHHGFKLKVIMYRMVLDNNGQTDHVRAGNMQYYHPDV